MQSTSETWKALRSSGAALQARAVIAGTAYTGISPPVIARALVQGGLGIGNAVSANCRFSMADAGSLPKSAAVVVEARLTNGTMASEWLPAGTFYISRRQRDPVTGLLALECYDALLKANALWTDDGAAWPRDMAALAGTLAARLGVALDGRTRLKRGAAYVVQRPGAGTTLRELLSRIAAANGGNWVMTPANALRLVPVASAAETVTVSAVVGGMAVGAAGEITGIRFQSEDGAVLVGDEGGIVLDADVGAAIAYDLYDALHGRRYQAFELQGAVYDPAAELGDGILAGAGGEVQGALYCETATLGPAFRGDLSAPESDELADEYPYIGPSTQAMQALRLSVQDLGEAMEGMVTGVGTEYARSQSATQPPGPDAAWGLTPPQWQEGWSIWQRTVTETAQGTVYGAPVCISGRDGEDATVLRIDSSRGTVFKNNQVSTVLSVAIYRGGARITDADALRAAFGSGAYLQWSWQRLDEDRFGLISADDSRLSGGGFHLTLTPEDVDVKVTFMCELMT